jgi:hypothetical protein
MRELVQRAIHQSLKLTKEWLTLITTGHPAAMAFTRGEMAHNQGKF